MIMTEEARKDRNSAVNKLVSEGLGYAEIAMKLNLSVSTVRRDTRKFGLSKPRLKNQSWKDIHNEAYRDYMSGMTVGEMAEKYNRTESSVMSFINRYGYKKNTHFVGELENSHRKTDLERYIRELKRIKKNIRVGDKLKYKGGKYIVEVKYSKFVVLRGGNYRTTALYDDFVRRRDDGSVIYG